MLREAKVSPDPLKAIQQHKSPPPRVPSGYACPLPADGVAIDLVPFNEEGLSQAECIHTDQLWLFWKHSKFQFGDAAGWNFLPGFNTLAASSYLTILALLSHAV